MSKTSRQTRIVLLVVLVILLAAAYLLPRELGRRRLAHALAAARRSGIPTTITELNILQGRIPKDQNMALRIQPSARAIEAWLHSDEGEALLTDLPMFGSDNPLRPDRTLSEKQRAAVDVFVKANRGAVDAIIEASGLEMGIYPIQWSATVAATPMPHLSTHRTAYWSVALSVLQACEERSQYEVAARLNALLRLNLALKGEASFLGAYTAVSSERLGPLMVMYALNEGVLGESEMACLQETLRDIPRRYRTSRMVRQRLYDCYESFLVIGGWLPAPSGAQAPEELHWYRRLPGQAESDLATGLTYLTELAEGADLPTPEALAWYQRHEAAPPRWKHAGLAVAAAMMRLSPAVSSQMELTALCRAADVALGIERYRIENGSWPDELSNLTPALLPDIPSDPFGSGELRYRKTDVDALIWSAGPDLVDNGGCIDTETEGGTPLDLGFRVLSRSAERKKQGDEED